MEASDNSQGPGNAHMNSLFITRRCYGMLQQEVQQEGKISHGGTRLGGTPAVQQSSKWRANCCDTKKIE